VSPSPVTPYGHALTTALQARCAPIETLVLDVDGVLTGGGIIYGDSGVELKAFHVRDGSGIKLWRRLGKRAAIITGRSSRVVDIRAAELGVEPVVQAAEDKFAGYRQLLAQVRVRPEQVCVIGDDLPDVPLLRNCGLAVAVADACPEARAEAHFITQARGGHGAVRETIERILHCQGAWQAIVEEYRRQRL
jgi:3-deoxy-D-manno-octulosonate 8-phosphate phosphatase (KDO 8-P phosphatase)